MTQITTLFLQSEIEDPYSYYQAMITNNPVFYDDKSELWAIYSYKDCSTILDHTDTAIPTPNMEGLNEYALLIGGKLARINNGSAHTIARYSASLLFERVNADSAATITGRLMHELLKKDEIDWVNTVCRKLPALVLLDAFGFAKADADFIAEQAIHLSKLIAPVKTSEQVAAINSVSKEVCHRIENHITGTGFYETVITSITDNHSIKKEEAISICVSNLAGLLIQSYDAGRGLLSNALLQMISQAADSNHKVNNGYLQKLVLETLRFDPPVHHTRRIATGDIILADTVIKKDDRLLIVLAAANRDPEKFSSPSLFDIERANNKDHLTFGKGMHKCLASHYSVKMVTGALSWLLEKYKNIMLAESDIEYEPLANVRLPKKIIISIT